MLHGCLRLLLTIFPCYVPFHGENCRFCVLFRGMRQTGLAGAWRRIFVTLVSGACRIRILFENGACQPFLAAARNSRESFASPSFQEQNPTANGSGNQPSQWECARSGDTSIRPTIQAPSKNRWPRPSAFHFLDAWRVVTGNETGWRPLRSCGGQSVPSPQKARRSWQEANRSSKVCRHGRHGTAQGSGHQG
ncbi:hypothetical protein B0I37DRAFT_172334 [Chaetomium sp. MPI-CAGE-AT-0009]|nr:hypothetical protein B0I37DRAFT_172334 [Chaetomium sp. MPI-CAGE-AT-0009]